MKEAGHQPNSVSGNEVSGEDVLLRVHNPGSARTLIYLPGVHGDWTLIGGFRRALGGRARFVEVTYPRTAIWSLNDYASGVTSGLASHGISRGWLLAESFGSQIAWQLVAQSALVVDGLILAGGFARHPAPWMAGLAALLTGRASFRLLRGFLFAYGQAARLRFRHSPETLASIQEFIARRTQDDCRVAKHRLELVARNDPREIVQQVRMPVYALTGLFDPIVPWYPAQNWLRQNCPGMSGYKVICSADHNVLGTAPQAAVAQVLEWMAKLPEPGLAGRHGKS
jgi:pimeloyl-ACP methyl ester carboxylesterase